MFDWVRNMPLVLLSKHDEQNILHKMTAFGSYIQIPFTYPILADKDFLYNVQQNVPSHPFEGAFTLKYLMQNHWIFYNKKKSGFFVTSSNHGKGSPTKYVRKIFGKTNISNPLIRKKKTDSPKQKPDSIHVRLVHWSTLKKRCSFDLRNTLREIRKFHLFSVLKLCGNQVACQLLLLWKSQIFTGSR